MPRPRICITYDEAIEAIEAEGSVRGAARKLFVSRSVVQKRLIEYGYPLRSREDAMAQARMMRSLKPTTKRLDVVTDLGATVVHRFVDVAVELCAWPACNIERATTGGLCAEHQTYVDTWTSMRCSWPHCHDYPISGPLCYAHAKRVAENIRSH